jgi:tetratricopeptide (TPR) repeat protein
MEKIRYITVLGLFAFAFQLSAQKTPDSNIYRAMSFAEKQLHDSAVYYLGLASSSLDNFPGAYIQYGRSLMAEGQYDIAIEKFSLAEKKETGIASFWLAKTYAHLGNLDKAIEYLQINLNSKFRVNESLILLDPDFQKLEREEKWKEFWKSTGNLSTLDALLFEIDYQVKSGNYTDAFEMVNGGLKRGLRKSPLFEKRANIHLAMQNHRMAVNDLSTAIEGDRRNVDLYEKRAHANMKLERYTAALEDYNDAIRLNPLNLQYFKERSEANLKSGNYDNAIADISFYIVYFPDDDDAWYRKGSIHFSNQAYLNSLEAFNKAIELNKFKADYFASRGETYMKTRTYRFAWNDFSMALDLNPNLPGLYLNKGIAAIHTGNRKDACFSFEMARRKGEVAAEEFIRKYCE